MRATRPSRRWTAPAGPPRRRAGGGGGSVACSTPWGRRPRPPTSASSPIPATGGASRLRSPAGCCSRRTSAASRSATITAPRYGWWRRGGAAFSGSSGSSASSCMPTPTRAPRRPPCGARSPRRGAGRDPGELELLVVSLDDALGDLPHARRVVLVLGLRLQRAALACDQHVVEGAEGPGQRPGQPKDAGLVEGLAGRVVLLAVGVARPRVGGQDDPGLCALDARLP